MPTLVVARPLQDATAARHIRTLARSRHAPADWIRRAQMIARSWDGLRATTIATELGCHPQTVRERIARFNAQGSMVSATAPAPGASGGSVRPSGVS